MESDNLLIIALRQIEAIPAELSSLTQLKPEDFIKAVIKVSTRITQVKGIENANLPVSLSRDMNQKYRECQRLVEFIKSTNYKASINLNNMLFPTVKEMSVILEHLLEIISREDHVNDTEYTERNVSQIKQNRKLQSFISETWILPEINNTSIISKCGNCSIIDSSHSTTANSTNNNKRIIILDKNTLKLIKRKAQGCDVDDRLKKIGQAKTQVLYEHSRKLNILTNDDCSVSSESLRLFSKILERVREGLGSVEGGVAGLSDCARSGASNSNWQEVFNVRNQGVVFHKDNFYENNFMSKVKLLKDRQYRLESYVRKVESGNNSNDNENDNENENDSSNNSNTLSITTSSNEMTFKSTNPTNTTNTPENHTQDTTTTTTTTTNNTTNQNKIQSQITTLQTNFEKDKSQILTEINDLSAKLETLTTNINDKLADITAAELQINEKTVTLKEYSKKNQAVLSSIESKLEAIENFEKIKQNKIKEEEIDGEIKVLEVKYNEMLNNWNNYSNQVNFQLNEVKEEVDTKKKEYNYKYEKISILKKEIDELAGKTTVKRELKNFLQDEFEKIPLEVNRNKYISKINDLSNSLSTEKTKWSKYLDEIRIVEEQLEKSVDLIKRIDSDLEEKIFQDAKNNSTVKDAYGLFIKIREKYNVIQKNMIDTQILKDKLREAENKSEDYRIKLKNYDLKQLEEQVEALKRENK